MRVMLLTSSVLIAVLAALRYLLRGKLSLRLQYALWLLVAVRLLVPVELGQSDLSILTLSRQAVQTPLAHAVQEVGKVSVNTRTYEEAYAQAAREYSSQGLDVSSLDSAAQETLNLAALELMRGQTLAETASRVLPVVWLAGAVTMAVWFGAVNLRFRGIATRRAQRLEVTECPVPLYVSPDVPSPCLIGLIRPTVYLTPVCAEDEIRRRHALAHELTHRRHLDPLWSLVRSLCLCLYWFDPLVWWAASLSKRDCELACDEGALRLLGSNQQLAYGRTLVEMVAIGSSPSGLLQTATTMQSGKRSIRERVILLTEQPKTLVTAAICLLVAVAVTIGCTFTGARNDNLEAAVPLTADELAYFNNEFFNGEDYNIRNQFLSSLYDVPEDINLYDLFYCGSELPETLAADERQAVIGAFYGGTDPDCGCTKISADSIDAVLTENLGLTLVQTHRIGLDWFHYLKEYGAYYHYHGDTNYRNSITFTAGQRRGDLVALFYGDDYAANSKVVTLREVGGGYRFVSNRYNGALPVSASTQPKEKPVLTVPVSKLAVHEPARVEIESYARQDWGELVDSLWYQGAGAEPNRSILVGVWPDGAIYACYQVNDNTASEAVYHRFAQICDAASAGYYLEHPDRISVEPFTDLFERDGFVLQSDGLCRYYFFGDSGDLRLLYSGYGQLEQMFSAGDDCIYAFSSNHGTDTPTMLIQKDGVLYRADLGKLLTRLAPKLSEPTLGSVSKSGGGVLRYYDTAGAQMPLCTRRVYCDGESLKFYSGDGKTYTDHVSNDIDVPDDVLAAAQDRARAAYQLMIENHKGNADWITWNLDDWRVTSLQLARTVTIHDLTVEIYTQSILVHSTTPEKVVMAGGTYITEDGWVAQDGLSGEYSILPFATDGGKRMLVTGRLANDYGVDSPAFDSDLRSLLMDNGLLSFLDLTGPELLCDFDIQSTRFLTRMGALTDAELDVLCQRLLVYVRTAGRDDQTRWSDALATATSAAPTMKDGQTRAYARIRAYADGNIPLGR